jgi:hypothetical protein
MRTGLSLAALLPLFLIGCATTSLTAAGSRVQDLDASRAAQCQYLGDISGSEYSGMLFAGRGLEGARAKVRNRAAEMGATHVVWGSIAAGGAVQAASAKAYRCSNRPAR